MILSLGSSRVWCVNERVVWREDLFLRTELDYLRRLLFDLVPPMYARQLVMGCERIASSEGRVAVLQLDICNFTVISQSLTANKLATIIHDLVSDFDELVKKRNLTKIDTIGKTLVI